MNLTERIEGLVVLVIDMQYGFLGYSEDRKIIPYQIDVLRFCKKTNTPVIVIEYAGAFLGKTICPILTIAEKIPSYRYIQKNRDSAFSNPLLEIFLKEFNAKKLVIMGVRADTCVYQTTQDAVLRNYEVALKTTLISGYKPHLEEERKDWYRTHTNYYEKV